MSAGDDCGVGVGRSSGSSSFSGVGVGSASVFVLSLRGVFELPPVVSEVWPDAVAEFELRFVFVVVLEATPCSPWPVGDCIG